MIFDLVQDFSSVLEAMPREHPRQRMLKLLHEAVRRDVHFIDRHPTTLFQCLWNTCWWYDCPEAARHYEEPKMGTSLPSPWTQPVLSSLVAHWHSTKMTNTPEFPWLRSLRPPAVPLGIGIVASFVGHNNSVYGIAVSRGEAMGLMVSGSHESIRIWDPLSGMLIASFAEENGDVHNVDISPDGAWVAATGDNLIRIYDVFAGAERVRLRANSFQVNDVAFSPDARWLASAANDGLVRIWDLEDHRPIAEFYGHKGHVSCVDVSDDGRFVASGGEDGTVRVWDAAEGHEICCFGGHSGHVANLVFFPRSGRIASASIDGSVCVWSINAPEDVVRMCGENSVGSVAVSPDSRRVATGSADGIVRLWDPVTGTMLIEHQTRGESIGCVAFVPTVLGACVAFTTGECLRGSGSFEISVWDPTDADQRRGLKGARDSTRLNKIQFSPDGRHLASTPGAGAVDVWDVESNFESCRRIMTGSFSGTDFSPDSSAIAAGAPDCVGGVVLWDARSGKPLHHIPGSLAPDSTLAFSDDGRFIVTSTIAGLISVWDVARNCEAARFRGVRELTSALAWSPDGSRFAVGQPNAISVWERDSGALVNWFAEYCGSNSDLSFGPDGRYLAAGGDDGHVFVWDLAHTRLVRLMPGVWDTAATVGRTNHRILSVATPPETTVVDYRSAIPLGWIPANLACLKVHPTKDLVVGVVYSDLHAYRYHRGKEAATSEQRTGSDSDSAPPAADFPAPLSWIDVQVELDALRLGSRGRSYLGSGPAEQHKKIMTFMGVRDDDRGEPGSDVGEHLEAVQMFLEQGHPDLAAELIADVADDSRGLLHNALAVCYLRMRRPVRALEILRPITLGAIGTTLQPGVPTAFAVNCAIALHFAGDTRSAAAILQQLDPFTATVHNDVWSSVLQGDQSDSLSLYNDPTREPGVLVLDALMRDSLEPQSGRTAGKNGELS